MSCVFTAGVAGSVRQIIDTNIVEYDSGDTVSAGELLGDGSTDLSDAQKKENSNVAVAAGIAQGEEKLADSMPALTAGVSKLDKGVADLLSGAGALKDGTVKVKDGYMVATKFIIKTSGISVN